MPIEYDDRKKRQVDNLSGPFSDLSLFKDPDEVMQAFDENKHLAIIRQAERRRAQRDNANGKQHS